ncbi:unnamed protein product [Absidia cylindrospora]
MVCQHYHYQQEQQQQTPAATSTITRSRSRSRLLPDQQPKSTSDLFIPHDQSSDDEEDMPEIRRSTNPLLNSYGVPTQSNNNNNTSGTSKQSRFPFSQQHQQRKPPVPTTASLGTGHYNNSSSSNHSLDLSDLNQKIRVCVRKRPLNKKELGRGEKDISPTVGIRSINVNEPKMKVDLTKYIEQHSFTFDDVFDIDDSNDQIYQRTAQPLVNYVFNGGKATCFAYGQTGSGKTYTMLDTQHGLYVLAARDVFSLLCQPEHQHLSAYIGFYEIYQGQLYDLLNARKKLFAREDGKQNVVIVGLKEYAIKNVDDLMKVFEYGNQCRSTGSTGANSDSSRSHAILQILLKPTKNKKTIIGKLSFIDLAGSERGADRGETDVKTRMEGAEINKSLLALKECIRALDQDKRHTPFRQSKLTQVLKDSFVGHSRTCMIATISPNQGNSEHTLNTLRYADRVKELKGEGDRRSSGETPPVRTRVTSAQDDDYLNDHAKSRELDGDGIRNGLSIRGDQHNSDDLDLSQDGDLFLGDEDFPSDGDVHILDEDFPHETSLHDINNDNDDDQDSYNGPSPPSPSLTTDLLRTGYLDNNDSDSSITCTRPKRQPTPYHRSPSGDDVSDTAIGGLVQNLAPINKQQNQHTNEPGYRQGQFNLSVSSSGNNRASSTTHHSGQLPGDYRRRMESTNSSSTITHASPRLLHSQPLPSQQQQGCTYQLQPFHRSQQQSTLYSLYDSPTIATDPATIEEFIKFHRAEIRETGECSKRETKLLTHISLTMASHKDDDNDNDNDTQQEGCNEKTTTEFHGYLSHLDQVLEMKMAAIDALRDRIRLMVGDEDDVDFY